MIQDFSKDKRARKRWETAGVIATLVIVLSVPMYLLKVKSLGLRSDSAGKVVTASFVGRDKCIDCHRKEYQKWQDSHHDKAMAPATDETVLGDFDNAVFEHHGIQTRFFRKGEAFVVHTRGPDGEMQDFPIAYTFGVTPLQQYLVPFPGGRLQCLTIAWDVVKKKWYHLYPDQPDDPTDWLHWTKSAQNWNAMCAECHSTHLQKNYDMKTDTYHTTWAEIDVSCEACHGPGSRHVEWAEVPEMARDQAAENYELVVNTRQMDARQQVELCARCHARRATLGDYDHSAKDSMDYMVPQLLAEGMYYVDGQILDEVYVYGSFIQSKMYKNNVMCRDCHDVHSAKRIKEGNDLCLQCHRADMYDTRTHHFHKKKGEKGDPVRARDGSVLYEVGEGALCVNCHMPGRYYMGIDFRNDHSLRVPRPDFTETLKTPNACRACHWDKPNAWSVEHFTKWYGISRKPHFGEVFSAGREGVPEAVTDLVRLAEDQLHPAIVRATALLLLRDYPGQESLETFKHALSDPESLVRHTAVQHMPPLDSAETRRLIVPLLYDPVQAVRSQAAMVLTSLPRNQLSAAEQARFSSALSQYQTSMEYVGDFPHGRFNLGNMYMNLGQTAEAEKQFAKAIEIDRLFYPAKVNLGMLYNQAGRNDEAERLFREVVESNPELYTAAYSLGLLLVEQKKSLDAVVFLKQAARGMPAHARVHYNLGLLQQQLGRYNEAEASLSRAYRLDPASLDYLYALADHYLKTGRYKEARQTIQEMVTKHPGNDFGSRMLEYLDRIEGEKKQ